MIKILPTAKLPNIKGSPATREKLATNLNNKFSELINDTYNKNGKVTKEDIEHHLNQLAPNVSITIRKIPPLAFFNGGVGSLYGKDSIAYGHEIFLPFEKGKIFDMKNISTLHHEINHFFRRITEPKYAIFWENKNLNDSMDQDSFYFYSSKLYSKETTDFKKSTVFENVNEFFKGQNFTRHEKVKMLHSWITGMIDESKAFNFAKEKAANSTAPIHESADAKKYHFSEKLEAIKELFWNEAKKNNV